MTDFLNHNALEHAIKTTVAEKLSSEAMMTKIESELDKTVSSAIHAALRPYSDTGKAITKAVEQALQVDGELGLPSYNETILRILRPLVQEHVDRIGQDKIKEEMEGLFARAPEEIKLSKLVEEFKETELHKEEWENGEITLIVEEWHPDHFHIYLDTIEGTEKRRCNYRIDVRSNGEVSGAELDYKGKLNKDTPVYFGKGHGFKKLLMNLYACGSKLIIDEDECDPSYGPDY
ncbi:hypothetical protein [Flexibacterium corallicola]|uniref:hypothetical protein n=1 Tax=Flexibacterium corallicola TaxID=3037259 RepID=UPI00286F6AB1|nr:hypothetical protein [Pseudovibrio sp. M1P-2-3]